MHLTLDNPRSIKSTARLAIRRVIQCAWLGPKCAMFWDTAVVRKQYHFWPGHDRLDAWDVDRLIELSRELTIMDVDPATIGELDSVYWFDTANPATVRAVIEHARLIAAVDPKYPVILGPDGRVMDGMHRIARALLDRRPTIRAVRFEELPPPDFVDCDPRELSYDR